MTDEDRPLSGLPIRLFLFIVGQGPNAALVIRNVESAIARCTSGRFALEVIDVYAQPERALTYRVLVTPALLAPHRESRMLGEFNEAHVLDYFLDSLLR